MPDCSGRRIPLCEVFSEVSPMFLSLVMISCQFLSGKYFS